MFELPEYQVLARQMGEVMTGKRISRGSLGNSPHRFVWYNRTPAEFARMVKGKVLGAACARGKWLFLPLEPGYLLVFGECGGRILFHADEGGFPKKYHLALHFEDGTALTATTQMWGAMELYEKGKEQERTYIKGMRITPLDRGFTAKYFASLVHECAREGSRSTKGLLTQDQLVPGLGNSISQDILFRARLHPRTRLDRLSPAQIGTLHRAIRETVREAIRLGGRDDETDLLGNPGRYARQMDASAVGRPCPACGTQIEKISYLGGACYFCPRCQEPG